MSKLHSSEFVDLKIKLEELYKNYFNKDSMLYLDSERLRIAVDSELRLFFLEKDIETANILYALSEIC